MDHFVDRLASLEGASAELRDDLSRLRALVSFDAASSLNKIRYITERVLRTLCERRDVSWGKAEPTLENMLGPLVAHGVVPRNVGLHLRTVQINASPGSHFQADPLSEAHLLIALLALLDVLDWYYRSSPSSDVQAGWLGSSVALSTRQADTVLPRPGDRYVRRAVEEFDTFYQDKALSSLRSALKVDPTHPMAHGYIILFDCVARPEVDAAVIALRGLLPGCSKGSIERTLGDAAVVLASVGPAAAYRGIAQADAASMPEVAFWKAELAYRAGEYAQAELGFRLVGREGPLPFQGRACDHFSAVLLLHHKTGEAAEVARKYVEAYPAEADSIGVLATTLALSGNLGEAMALAQEALALREHEDTRAGLAKVHAYRGEFDLAASELACALQQCGAARRCLRRAALGMVLLLRGSRSAARDAVACCLEGGAEASLPNRAAAHLVAALVDPELTPGVIASLRRMADESRRARKTAVERPELLARLLEAWSLVGAGEALQRVLVHPARPLPCDEDTARARALLEGPGDLLSIYHVPFAASLWWLVAVRARPAEADELLEQASSAYPADPLLRLESTLRAAGADPNRAREQLETIDASWPSADPDSAIWRVYQEIRSTLR